MSDPERRRALGKRRTNPLVVVAVLVFAMAAYFVLIGIRGFFLLSQPQIVLKVLGAAVLLLPLIGIWVVIAELRFGAASQRLAEQLTTEGASAGRPELPLTSRGRVDRDAADAWFEIQRRQVEAEPGNWRGWFHLAHAYDLAGDRKRARQALRTAIERAAPSEQNHQSGPRP